MDFDIENMDFPLPDQEVPTDANLGGMTKEQIKEEIKNWMCIYPVYIDSTKTKEQGRKLGKEYCCEKPQSFAMLEAMGKLRISSVLEDKKHPRDQLRIGRLRVNYTGNKKELLKKIAKLVPECQKELDEKRKAEEAATASANASSSSSKPTSNNKKSNKKKGKKRR
ncbi:signal recognition particle, SRP19 subunit [Neocallimastix lanati (nom. inval.)]|uniref:Signal recognition particle, SRP19 subunit n=1 Tax=Neocallimastix californiae TaxID=1754190 RepID=A0A1Y2D0Y1_9FUNG|nr:signal recognition particle, SRP19 subunit [Neocallimastix sp. JGI-2020a]ORY52786.1 signal recognition particle, SRP19 subunit [Neocallimastix californiae]|eukprot:ORY52786.1 signal recognition particle, SRP19 subunit [Neocallimastix californiae]